MTAQAALDFPARPAREWPGLTQPVQSLLGFGQDWSIRQASAAVGEWLGGGDEAAAALLGRPAHAVISGEALHEIRSRAQMLAGGLGAPIAERMQGLDLAGDGRLVDATLEADGRGWWLAFEPAAAGRRDSIGTAMRMAAALREADGMADLCAAAARDVRALTGFDRVQVLRFGDCGDLVLGESAGAAAAGFAPLMFGAAGVDGHAALQRHSGLRMIADRDAAGVPILARDGAVAWAGELAGAAPDEVAALAAMGARAMFSVPVMRRGEAWGAIAAWHLAPRLVPFAVRPALELLALALGLLVEIAEPAPAGRATGEVAAAGAAVMPLAGRVLVVEDNMLIAMEAEEVAIELGAEACDVAGSVAAALRLIEAHAYDFALLDIDLGRETSEAVAVALAARGVRILYASGYGGPGALGTGFPPAAVVTKPYGAADLAAAIAAG